MPLKISLRTVPKIKSPGNAFCVPYTVSTGTDSGFYVTMIFCGKFRPVNINCHFFALPQLFKKAIITNAPEIMPPTYQRAAHWVASSTNISLHPLVIQAVGAADGADTVASLIQCAGLHVKPRFPAVGVVHAAVGALEFGRGADAGGNIGVIAQ